MKSWKSPCVLLRRRRRRRRTENIEGDEQTSQQTERAPRAYPDVRLALPTTARRTKPTLGENPFLTAERAAMVACPWKTKNSTDGGQPCHSFDAMQGIQRSPSPLLGEAEAQRGCSRRHRTRSPCVLGTTTISRVTRPAMVPTCVSRSTPRRASIGRAPTPSRPER